MSNSELHEQNRIDSKRFGTVQKPGIVFLRFGLVFFLLVFAVSVLFGTYSRYVADDWCTARRVVTDGFWEAQRFWYTKWSGRFSFTFLISAVETIGPRFVPFSAALLLILWVSALTWAFHPLVKQHPKAPRLLSLLVASLVVYVTLDSMPNLYQSFFWQTGSFTYIAPLVFAALYLGIVIQSTTHSNQERISYVHLGSGALLTMIAGGFSEMYVAMQTVLIVIALGALYLSKHSRKYHHVVSLLFAGLVGSVVAMIIIIIAPGNAVRMLAQPSPPGVVELILLSLKFGLHFIGKSVLLHPVPAALAGLIPLSFGFWMKNDAVIDKAEYTRNNRDRLIFLLVTPVAAYFIMVSAMMPSVYGVSAYPPDRALPVPQFGFTLIVILWSFFAGVTLKGLTWVRQWNQRLVTTLLLISIGILLIAGPLSLTYRIVIEIPSAKAFAAKWDERDMLVRSAVNEGLTEIELATIGRIGDLPDIRETSDHWINVCFAAYYDLDLVVSE